MFSPGTLVPSHSPKACRLIGVSKCERSHDLVTCPWCTSPPALCDPDKDKPLIGRAEVLKSDKLADAKGRVALTLKMMKLQAWLDKNDCCWTTLQTGEVFPPNIINSCAVFWHLITL